MILPDKHIRAENALIGVGSDILYCLENPKVVSILWDDVQKRRDRNDRASSIEFDWFILALDFLFMVGAVITHDGLIVRGGK